MSNNSNQNQGDNKQDLALLDKEKVSPPRMWKVLVHNDDYTTMEFVVFVFMKFFKKTPEDAQKLTLKIHNEGLALAGIYTFEIAETLSGKVNKYARSQGHPLKTSIEPCENDI